MIPIAVARREVGDAEDVDDGLAEEFVLVAFGLAGVEADADADWLFRMMAVGFRALIRSIHTHHWVVYVKPPFGGPKQVLRYLGRYTHRVAISNHRLISFDDNQVQFHWRDYRNGNTTRKMTVTAEEFIRRFLLHVLPKRFVRIRYFGIMANAHRKPLLGLCREFLSPVQQSSEKAIPEPSTPTTNSTWTCPSCGGPIRVLERLSALQIALRERLSLCTAFNTS